MQCYGYSTFLLPFMLKSCEHNNFGILHQELVSGARTLNWHTLLCSIHCRIGHLTKTPYMVSAIIHIHFVNKPVVAIFYVRIHSSHDSKRVVWWQRRRKLDACKRLKFGSFSTVYSDLTLVSWKRSSAPGKLEVPNPWDICGAALFDKVLRLTRWLYCRTGGCSSHSCLPRTLPFLTFFSISYYICARVAYPLMVRCM